MLSDNAIVLLPRKRSFIVGPLMGVFMAFSGILMAAKNIDKAHPAIFYIIFFSLAIMICASTLSLARNYSMNNDRLVISWLFGVIKKKIYFEQIISWQLKSFDFPARMFFSGALVRLIEIRVSPKNKIKISEFIHDKHFQLFLLTLNEKMGAKYSVDQLESSYEERLRSLKKNGIRSGVWHIIISLAFLIFLLFVLNFQENLVPETGLIIFLGFVILIGCEMIVKGIKAGKELRK